MRICGLTTVLATLAVALIATGSAGAAHQGGPKKALVVATTGSDANPCTAAAPCASFDRAYHLATPGQVVEIQGGDYGDQTITPDDTKVAATAAVVFQPARRAQVTLLSGNGELNVYGPHVEFDNLTVSDWYVHAGADGVTLRDITATCCFFVDGASDLSVLGGSAGPVDNVSNQITSYDWRTGAFATEPRNILIDGITIHGFHQTDGFSHVDCLHVMAGGGITISDSRFYDCEHFDILFTTYGDTPSPHDVTIENNFLDCCRSGYFSIYLGDSHGEVWQNFLIRYNSSDKEFGIGPDNVVAGGIRYDANVVPSVDCSRSGVVADYDVLTSPFAPVCGIHDTVAPARFVDQAALDFHLSPGSTAIGHGDPAAYPARDIDGDRRPRHRVPDAGADETRY